MSHRPRTAALVALVSFFATMAVAPSAVAQPAGAASAAVDLARGRPVTASSAQAGHAAPAGNDGDAATRWCAASGATGQWWQVDLGAEADLSGTEVSWEFARDYRYRVETSTDATTWTLAADRTAGADTAQVRSDAFTTRARYVRVTVTGLPASTWASFTEFRVLGTTGEPAPTGPEPNPQDRARCTGTGPVTCHYDVAPGHYDVTVVLGDATRAGVTTVLAEARRVMLPTITTAAGQLRRLWFTVNVRQPEGQPTGQGGVGTPGLDLTFDGSAPRLDGIGVAATRPPVLYLAGDSTVCDQPVAPYAGWGQHLTAYLGAGLSVANYADSGESSGSFLRTSTLFPTMRPLIRPGDLTLIQFGHNDKETTASAFTANLRDLVAGVRAQGGTPVLVTPPVRRGFSGGRLTPTALHVNGVGVDLPAVMRQVAADTGVALIDLTARSRALVEGLGEAGSQRIYLSAAADGVDDNTHFSAYGGDQMARLVLDGIREAGIAPLLPFIRP